MAGLCVRVRSVLVSFEPPEIQIEKAWEVDIISILRQNVVFADYYGNRREELEEGYELPKH